MKMRGWMIAAVLSCGLMLTATADARAEEVVVPLNRSELLYTQQEMSEVMVANPEIADVHVHGTNKVSVIGKQIGRTSLRIFDKKGDVIRDAEVLVTYDLPAIRRALSEFLPNDPVGVKLVNTNLALIGEVRDPAIVEQAMQIVNEFVKGQGAQAAAGAAAGPNTSPLPDVKVINLLKVGAGQQVMLRVRVGEIQRTALKKLGAIISGGKVTGPQGGFIGGGSGGGTALFGSDNTFSAGEVTYSGDNLFGFLAGNITNGNFSLTASLDALETQGMFKVLAEPNLVALSGENAEFLAGGEFPIPVINGAGGGGGGNNAQQGIEYKKYGVSVQFAPFVLGKNRIRLAVSPEVSELGQQAQVFQGITIPTLNTRRAKTTVELAPGESFMIAGLIRDQINSAVNQIPGLSEIPIFSSLMRSTSYQRNETELVIAVTPYIVDPVASGDVRLPTDNFRPASTMEQFFYGALGAISKNSLRVAEHPQLEGPIGFMVD